MKVLKVGDAEKNRKELEIQIDRAEFLRLRARGGEHAHGEQQQCENRHFFHA